MMSETTKNKRNKLIQLIHIGKAKIGLDGEAYRAFLDGICGKDSSADMTICELEKVLKAMRGLGFNQNPRRVKPDERGVASASQLEYIKGMWAKCARNKSDTALRTFVKRIAGVEALRFLDVRLAQKVILALREMMTKAGFDPDTSEVAAMPELKAVGNDGVSK